MSLPTGLALLLVVVAVHGLHVQEGAAPPTAPPLDTLAAQCARGKIDAGFEEACRAVVESDVRRRGAAGGVPEDFFDWLGSTRRLRDDATLAIATVGPKVALNLERLRAFDERVVERYPSLAVAYAAAWACGDDDEPRRFWVDEWLARGRDVPGMLESFVYHTERRGDMRLPLRAAPWKVLAHLADSLVPIAEREWALETYRARKTAGLRDLFGAVPYTLDPERGDAPYTLESFLTFGGACTHNVQFAGGVFDSFGIPSGWAGGPGHTYPYWFEMDGGHLSIHRTNEIGNRNGKIRDPLSDGHVWEDELRLLVRALDHSIDGERRASLAAWAYGRVEASDRAAAAAILPAAVKQNPFCHGALSALADATGARQLSLEDAGRAWKSVAAALEDRPHDLPPLLERALPKAGDASPTFAGDDALLKGLARDWSQAGRDELVLEARVWRGRALASRGRRADAARLLRDAAKDAAASAPERFVSACDALAGAFPGAPDSTERVAVLTALMLDLDLPDTGEWSPLHRSRVHATRALVQELVGLDRAEDAAAAWYSELAQIRGGDAGTGRDEMLVGGDGGEAFEVAPAGAELIGLRLATTGFDGRSVVGCVQGIFAAGGEVTFAERAGQPRSGEVELRAPEGWRVAGLVAAGSDRVDGLQLVYVPRDRRDRRIRLSPWVGSNGDRVRLLGGRDVRIVGLRGRAGADVDAIGLLGSDLD